MDDNRFDAMAKFLGASTERRGALALLATLGIGWFGGNVETVDAKKKNKNKRKKKRKRKPQPICPMEPLDRCAKPVLEALVAATESCRAGCDDPDSAACLSCLDPAVDQATGDIIACLEQTCRGGTGSTEAGGELEAATVRAAADIAAQAASCNSAAYDTCVDRNNRDLATCLIKELAACEAPRSCGVNLAACVIESRNRASDCIADHGCKGAGYCKQNICCPHWADTVCNGVCCATSKCETCENGVCKGCGKDQVCTVSPAQVRTCRCTRNLEECGDQCCDHFACEECALVDGVGTCFAGCTPPKVCERGAFTGSCECPPGTECGETCCDKEKCETCDGNGSCRGCQGKKVCRDKKCQCPTGRTPCGANNCCGAEQFCYSGSCGCVDGTPCGFNCCGASEECVAGECKEKTCPRPGPAYNPNYTKVCANDVTGGNFCCDSRSGCKTHCCVSQDGRSQRCCYPEATCDAEGFCNGGFVGGCG